MTSSDAVMMQLPNGFHDAELQALNVDLVGAGVRLRVEFWTGNLHAPAGAEREATRVGELRLYGVSSMLIGPPEGSYEFTMGTGVDIDGGTGGWPEDPAPPEDGLVRFWFWVSTWNSKMLFTAESCELEWKE